MALDLTQPPFSPLIEQEQTTEVGGIELKWLKKALQRQKTGFKQDKRSINSLGISVSDTILEDNICLAYGNKNLLTHLLSVQCVTTIDFCYNLVCNEIQLQANEKKHGKKIKRLNIPSAQVLKIRSSSIGISAFGIGRSYYHFLAQKGFQTTLLGEDNLTESMLRDQIWLALRTDLRDGNIAINVDDTTTRDKLVLQLITPKFWLKGERIIVESKNDTKKRTGLVTDLGDSVAYWNWMRRGQKAYP